MEHGSYKHRHCWYKAGPQRDVVGKERQHLSACALPQKAAEAHQQVKRCSWLLGITTDSFSVQMSLFSLSPCRDVQEQPWKKNATEKEKTHGSKHRTGVSMSTRALIWQKVGCWCPQWVCPSPWRWNGGFLPLCAMFAPWASAVRALGLLQPKETFCPCIHNLGTIRSTNWPLGPLLIYSNFYV